MPKFRSLVLAGPLALVLAAPACADSAVKEIKLGHLISSPAAPTFHRAPALLGTATNVSVHAGIMFLPKGAVDVGGTVSTPNWTVGDGWVPRFDVNVLINADLDGDDTALSLTANLVKDFPNLVANRTIYFGGGLGWMFGGDGSFQAKLILGTPITDRVSIEANTHFIEGTVAWTILGRLHL